MMTSENLAWLLVAFIAGFCIGGITMCLLQFNQNMKMLKDLEDEE